jgi:glycolate oxidase FAD binding subunit
VDLTALAVFAKDVGGLDDGPVTCVGARTQWDVGGAVDDSARDVRAPRGIVEFEPAEMVVRVRCGTSVAELDDALAEHRQQVALDPPDRTATIGGVLAVGASGLRRLRYGPVRDTVLEVTAAMADGKLVKAGGPVVKNVSGYDLARLLVGSVGTIGFLAEVVLRCSPRPAVTQWLVSSDGADPFDARRRLFRPSAILWNGTRTWVHLEGHAADVRAEAGALGPGWAETDGPPPLPSGGRVSMRPSELRDLTLSSAGPFVAEIGVGTAHLHEAPPPRGGPSDPLHAKIKAAFDPTGRMNPGRRA